MDYYNDTLHIGTYSLIVLLIIIFLGLIVAFLVGWRYHIEKEEESHIDWLEDNIRKNHDEFGGRSL